MARARKGGVRRPRAALFATDLIRMFWNIVLTQLLAFDPSEKQWTVKQGGNIKIKEKST